MPRLPSRLYHTHDLTAEGTKFADSNGILRAIVIDAVRFTEWGVDETLDTDYLQDQLDTLVPDPSYSGLILIKSDDPAIQNYISGKASFLGIAEKGVMPTASTMAEAAANGVPTVPQIGQNPDSAWTTLPTDPGDLATREAAYKAAVAIILAALPGDFAFVEGDTNQAMSKAVFGGGMGVDGVYVPANFVQATRDIGKAELDTYQLWTFEVEPDRTLLHVDYPFRFHPAMETAEDWEELMSGPLSNMRPRVVEGTSLPHMYALPYFFINDPNNVEEPPRITQIVDFCVARCLPFMALCGSANVDGADTQATLVNLTARSLLAKAHGRLYWHHNVTTNDALELQIFQMMEDHAGITDNDSTNFSAAIAFDLATIDYIKLQRPNAAIAMMRRPLTEEDDVALLDAAWEASLNEPTVWAELHAVAPKAIIHYRDGIDRSKEDSRTVWEANMAGIDPATSDTMRYWVFNSRWQPYWGQAAEDAGELIDTAELTYHLVTLTDDEDTDGLIWWNDPAGSTPTSEEEIDTMELMLSFTEPPDGGGDPPLDDPEAITCCPNTNLLRKLQ